MYAFCLSVNFAKTREPWGTLELINKNLCIAGVSKMILVTCLWNWEIAISIVLLIKKSVIKPLRKSSVSFFICVIYTSNCLYY